MGLPHNTGINEDEDTDTVIKLRMTGMGMGMGMGSGRGRHEHRHQGRVLLGQRAQTKNVMLRSCGFCASSELC